jgi:MFS transporter
MPSPPRDHEPPAPAPQPLGPAAQGDAASRAFWTYWTGQTISTFGSSITTVVLPLLIFQLTRSALTLSFTLVASVLPYLLFGLLIGAWVDRVNRRRLMIFADLGRASAIAAIPLASAVGMLSVWWIYAVAFLSSTLTIGFDAANFAAVPALVRADELVRANGRIQASYATMRVAGPLLAGVLLAVLTLPQLLWFDAGSFLVSAGSLLLVGVSFNTARPALAVARQEAEQAAPLPAARKTIWREIGEGLGYVLGHPVLRTITVLLLLINFILPTVSAQLVLFGSAVLGASASQIGFLYAGASGGTVLVSLLAPRIGRRPPLGQLALAGLGVEGLAILLAAQLHVYGVVLLLWAVRGGADVLFTISSYSLTQRVVPSQLLGRTITVIRVLTWSTASLGAVLGGLAIAQTANPVLVYSVIGAGVAIVSLVFCWTPVGAADRSMPTPTLPSTKSAEV